MKNILKNITIAAFLATTPMAAAVVLPDVAVAQSVKLQTQVSEIYAGMPFQLSVVVEDFNEKPQPEIAPFEIPNATVQFIGVSPRISSMTTMINGRITSKKEVTYVFNYQVTPKTEGQYTIPVIVATQGTQTASSAQPVAFTATSVQTTKDMRIELQVPDRKFWVGETFEATLAWYLRKDVAKQEFSIPMLEMPDTFDVAEPEEARRGWSIPLTVGSRQLAFPYTRDTVMINGLEYTRFLISMKLTPLKSGVIQLPPSQVLAELESGRTQDMWGFGRANYQLFKAEDIARTCTVQELPQASRPNTFANAMGSDFTISVNADRTIVKAGDPIILTIDISSPSSLDGLILPSLVAAGLNEQLFGVSTEDPIGENIEGAEKRYIKRFTVPVRIKSERVTEIPPLAFSYFNPKTEEFTTVRSQPIALSVTAVDKISVDDVVIGTRPVQDTPKSTPTTEKPERPLVDPTAGALDLGLTSTDEHLKNTRPTSTLPIQIGLYTLPFVAWLALALTRRTRKSRQANASQREATQHLKTALNDAHNISAKEGAAAITNALNAFLMATESPREPFKPLIERMEIEAYRPSETSKSLPEDLIDELRSAIKTHVNPAFAKLIASLLAAIMAFAVAFGLPSMATAGDSQQLHDEAVAAYHKAMETTDRSDRIAHFKQAYGIFHTLATRHPGNTELYIDAGNAALGAADFAHAALSYKRALMIEPMNKQAQSNLAYIQSVQGERSADNAQLLSNTFFLNEHISRDTRLLIAAILFALAMFLFIPWFPKGRRITAYLAIFPMALWGWMLAGALFEPESHEAIVMDEVFLKTADNAGASNVSTMPLEPGFTVQILKTYNNWVQIQTSSGETGWLQNSAIEPVQREII